MKLNRLHLVCLCLGLGTFRACLLVGDPAPERIEIPIPSSSPIVFRAIHLGLDGRVPIATKEITMGCRGEPEFREWLTRFSISGSFVGEWKGKSDWLYYLADAEVSGSLWAAIMGGEAANPDLPKTGITMAEIQSFLEKLNVRVRASALERLPMYGGERGFIRLPTEGEWEFAARGGVAVDERQFDQPHPYPETDLSGFEWFFQNSNGHLQRCRLLKPNPVGLYDMLGNAAEMVHGLYSFEYTQGRLGGYIARGAKCTEPVRNLRASRRAELAPCAADGNPVRDPNIGFRLALSSMVFGPQMSGDTLNHAWMAHLERRPVPVSAPSNPPTVDRSAELALEVARDQIRRLQEQMQETVRAQTGRANDAKQVAVLEEQNRDQLRQINMLSAKLTDLSSAIQTAARRDAEAWVRVASLSIFEVYKASEKIDALGPVASDPGFKSRIDDQRVNLRESFAQYLLALESLSRLEPGLVATAIEAWEQRLEGEKIRQQRAAMTPVRHHLDRAKLRQLPEQKTVIDDVRDSVRRSRP